MLKKEEVQAMLDKMASLKAVKPAAKGKPVVQSNETLINARVRLKVVDPMLERFAR